MSKILACYPAIDGSTPPPSELSRLVVPLYRAARWVTASSLFLCRNGRRDLGWEILRTTRSPTGVARRRDPPTPAVLFLRCLLSYCSSLRGLLENALPALLVPGLARLTPVTWS